MVTRDDFVNDVKTKDLQIYNAIGKNDQTGKSYLDLWADNGFGSSTFNREFAIYEAEGFSNHLRNVMRCYLSLPSVGYSDFSDAKKVQGDQYRGYLARARAVYDMEVAELGILQANNASQSAIDNQQAQIANALANYRTWLNTYLNAIASNTIV